MKTKRSASNTINYKKEDHKSYGKKQKNLFKDPVSSIQLLQQADLNEEMETDLMNILPSWIAMCRACKAIENTRKKECNISNIKHTYGNGQQCLAFASISTIYYLPAV